MSFELSLIYRCKEPLCLLLCDEFRKMINEVFFKTSFYSPALIFVLWNDINKKKEDV